MSWILVALGIAGCAGSPAPPPPAAAEAPTPTPEPGPADALLGEWGCGSWLGVAAFHSAHLEIGADGRFELQRTNTDPSGGLFTWWLGPWRFEDGALYLTPEQGTQKRWRGDAHRHAHGEDVYFQEETEAVYTYERRLPVTQIEGRAALELGDLGITLVQRPEDGEPLEWSCGEIGLGW